MRDERLRSIERLWSALEERPRLRAGRQEIMARLEWEYDLAAPFLRTSGEKATRYPCPFPSGPGCPRRVMNEPDGSIRAVCGCTPKECDTIILSKDDDSIVRFDDPSFAQHLRQQLGVSGDYQADANGDLITLGTIRPASGERLPVVLLLTSLRDAAEALIWRIEHTYRQGAVILTLTENSIAPQAEGRLGSRFTWLVLSDLIFGNSSGLTANRKLVDVVAQRTTSTLTRSEVGTEGSYLFRRENEVWALSFDRTTVHLPDRSGMGHIQELLRRPHTAIEAATLAGALNVGMQVALREMPSADSETIRQVRATMKEKQTELDGLSKKDWARRGELQDEIGKISTYLRQIQDNRGQPRKMAGNAQRSRTAVTTAINRARDYIAKHHPSLGLHLRESIRTGTSPIYAPSEVPDWQF
jgi:hypothetical protein